MTAYLKEFIRNEKQQPIGIAVAVKEGDQILYGFSLCHRNDRFDKELGLKIATQRAIAGEYNMPLSKASRDKILAHYDSLVKRSLRYFKDIAPENITLETAAIQETTV